MQISVYIDNNRFVIFDNLSQLVAVLSETYRMQLPTWLHSAADW